MTSKETEEESRISLSENPPPEKPRLIHTYDAAPGSPGGFEVIDRFNQNFIDIYERLDILERYQGHDGKRFPVPEE